MILVAIPSYRRRAGLLRLLAALERQAFSSGPEPPVRIAVVDNSPDHELGDLARDPPLRRWPFALLHEPQPGVSAARNRLLAVAEAEAALFVAFIDDDEEPAPDWLDALLARQRETGADVVLGAVQGIAPPGAARALAAQFDTPPRPAFRGVSAAHTANVLVRRAAIADVRFEPALGLVGGEDTVFFTRLLAAGAQFAEAPHAIVRETIPAERATLRWLLRRWARTGATHAAATLLARPAGLRRAALAAAGVARLAAGGGLAAGGALLNRPHGVVNGLRIASRGFGVVCGALGLTPVAEYRRK